MNKEIINTSEKDYFPPSWKKYLEILSEYQIKHAQANSLPVSSPSTENPQKPKLKIPFFKRKTLTPPNSTHAYSITPEQKELLLSQANKEFKSQIFSNFELAFCHLWTQRNNPQDLNSSINEYLSSPEINTDTSLFSKFLLFCFQKTNLLVLSPYEAVQKIKETNPLQYPREIQKTISRVLKPILEKASPKNDSCDFKIFCQELSSQYIQKRQSQHLPLPSTILEEYQKYVRQKIFFLLGLPLPNNQETSPPSKSLTPQKPSSAENSSVKEETPLKTSSTKDKDNKTYEFFILPSRNTNPRPLNSFTPQEIEKIFRQAGVKNFTYQEFKELLDKIKNLSPQKIILQYPQRVSVGPFEGWHKIRIGGQGRILLKMETINDQIRITFRVGSHEKVYGTRRKKPKDESRRL